MDKLDAKIQESLRKKINIKIQALIDKMVVKFGPPPEHGIYPELKWIFDVWNFYNDNCPQIRSFHDEDNIQMAFYVGERRHHMVEQAQIVYGLSAEKFFTMLKIYDETGNIEKIPMFSETEMKKQIDLIEAVKHTEEITEYLRDNPHEHEILKETKKKYFEEHSNGEPFCLVCGDTSDQCPLITIVNSDDDNKLICEECMKNQTKLFGLKFSKIKQNRSFILNKLKCDHK